MKQRSIGVSIVLTLITCGIYGLFWFVSITDDMEQLSGETTASGVMALVLTVITCGIYGLYWAFKMGDKIDTAKQRRGMAASNGGILYLILYLLGGILAYALIQYEINRLLEKDGIV